MDAWSVQRIFSVKPAAHTFVKVDATTSMWYGRGSRTDEATLRDFVAKQ
jgi:hypothetical protein